MRIELRHHQFRPALANFRTCLGIEGRCTASCEGNRQTASNLAGQATDWKLPAHSDDAADVPLGLAQPFNFWPERAVYRFDQAKVSVFAQLCGGKVSVGTISAAEGRDLSAVEVGRNYAGGFARQFWRHYSVRQVESGPSWNQGKARGRRRIKIFGTL